MDSIQKLIDRIIFILRFWIYLLQRYLPIQIIIKKNQTEIKVSISNRTVECINAEECLTIYDNKILIVGHPVLMNTSNPPLDPLYTGIEITENWRAIIEEILQNQGGGSIECLEPPPPGLGGGEGRIRSDEFASNFSRSSTPLVNKRKAQSFVPLDNEIAFLPYNEYADPEAGTPFLSVSVFQANFDQMLNLYTKTDIDQQDSNAPQGEGFSYLISDGPNTEPFTGSFTVYTHLDHYVTIVQTTNPEYVFRFAYREKDRFDKSVALEL